ncbi:MAG TPA: hypothetical protein VGI81_22810 [Tepidisphaeraceae bacterium]
MKTRVTGPLSLAFAVTLLAGCAANHPASKAAPVAADDGLRSASGHSSMSVSNAGALASVVKPDPKGARKIMPVVIALDVYHLTVPAGAISRNDEFWKRVDEDRVDIGVHDLLLKNGIRIGVGRDQEWPYFKGLLGAYPSSRSARGRTEPGKEGYIEIAMKTKVPEQVIFGLDDQGHDWGRRFELCDDLLGISFIASTHNPGEATVKVCPIVRGLRRYFRTTIYNEESQFELTQPEHLYDMRLEARLPLNDFLIVAPSTDAKTSTSMGNVFLTTEGHAEPVEHCLVIVPRAYRTDEPTAPDGK